MSTSYPNITDKKPSPATGLNFVYQSSLILSECVGQLIALDYSKVLGNFQDLQVPDLRQVKDFTLNTRKLFYVDLERRFIYWEVLKKQRRTIIRESLDRQSSSEQFKYETTSLNKTNLIVILGKWKYLQLKKPPNQNEQSLNAIHMNVVNNAYVNFQDFHSSFVNLINSRLVHTYDGRILKFFKNHQFKEQLHQQLWEYIAMKITTIWTKFQEYLDKFNTVKEYTTALYKDFSRLFKTNLEFTCTGGLTSPPQKEKMKNDSYIERAYASQNDKTILQMDQSFYPMKIDLFLNSNSNSDSLLSTLPDESYYKYPHPENYPLLQESHLQAQSLKGKQDIFRRSLKRPANTCYENCVCLKNDGQKCPNMQRKIECEHHNCRNSMMRDKKEFVCWYLDNEKNLCHINSLQKVKLGQQLTEFHSFGLDFHTVTILYYLLPFNKIEDDEISHNEEEKRFIIETLIPYQVSKTHNLFQAVKNISQKRQYESYRYEARILEKKLKWIRLIQRKNLQNQIKQQQMILPTVYEPKCYYKGLGVMNLGLKIPQNKFIGEFVGQIMPPYRIQEKQEVINNKNLQNQIRFYCINFCTHIDELGEHKFYTIDPQNKGNFCRNLNHSCNPNCKVQAIVSEGKYILAVYTIREINENQELTFDYISVTDNISEHQKAVCLCSSLSCRGRYMGYQEQIYKDLDRNYLQKENPIKNRIKKLILCCKNSHMKIKNRCRQIEKLQYLKKKQVSLSVVPKPIKRWMLQWMYTTEKIIEEEIQYLASNEVNESVGKLKYSICEKTRTKDPKYLESEKIATFNSKIEKISHLLTEVNDFSPPFTFQSHENLLLSLESVLNEPKPSDNSKNTKPQINHQLDMEKRIRTLRYGLFTKGVNELKTNKNVQKAFMYFQKAFQFEKINIYGYPDYISEPIKIWRENNSKFKDTVQYYGKDLYILQNLIVWAGEFKKINKTHEQRNRPINQKEQIEKEKKGNKKEQKGKEKKQKEKGKEQEKIYIEKEEQMSAQFKAIYLRQQTRLAIIEMQEAKFRLKMPVQIKNKNQLKPNTDIKKLRNSLENWIKKQLSFIEQPVKKQTKSRKKQSIKSQEVKIQYI